MNFRRIFLWLLAGTLVLALTATFFAVTFTGDKLYGAEGQVIYSGETRWGKPHGEGLLTDERGVAVYRGEWKKGYPHGEGIAYKNRSDYYDGQWIRGLPSGHGTLALTKGQGSFTYTVWYVGDWLGGSAEGTGHYYDGSYRYDGDWVKGMPNGQGMLFYPEPWSEWIFYEGDIVEGIPQGYGHFTLTGREYKGHVAGGVPAGEGTEYTRSGTVLFNGNYQGGVRHGIGEEHPGHSELDSYYQGDWYNGSRHGTGSEFFPENESLAFTGQWIGDMYYQGKGYDKLGSEQSGKYFQIYNWLIQNGWSMADVTNAVNALKYSRNALSLEQFKDALPDSEKRFLIGLLMELPENYSIYEVNTVFRAINSLPMEHLFSLVNGGFKIRLVNGLVTDEPELAYLTDAESERGIPYADSLGVASYSEQLLVIRLSFPGVSANTALHEIGHALDYFTGIQSSNSAFEGFRIEEAGKVFDQEYYTDFPEEYFAQFYAQMYIGRQTVDSRFFGEQLRLRAPKTYWYLENIFAGLEPYEIYEQANRYELASFNLENKANLHPIKVEGWVAENLSEFVKIYVRPSAFSAEELMEAWPEAEIITWLQQERYGFFYNPDTKKLAWRHSGFPAAHYLILALDQQGDWNFGELASDLEYYRLPEEIPLEWPEVVAFPGNLFQTFIGKVWSYLGR